MFLVLLSNVRQGAERGTKIYQEISQLAQNPDIKEALDARAFISEQTVDKLDRCFELLGEKPVKSAGRLQETFIEDFRRELAEIQSPVAKHLFILAKANDLTHLRIGEYVTLTVAADLDRPSTPSVYRLAPCSADRLAFVE